MAEFSKIRFFSNLGLLAYRFNYELQRFESSLLQRFKATLILLLMTSFSFKYYLSTLFDRQDPVQLAIGNVGAMERIPLNVFH